MVGLHLHILVKGVHERTLLMSPSLLLQQCPTCLVHLILMVLVMESQWLYNCIFVGCCFQDLFPIGRSIFGQFLLSFSSLLSTWCIHVVVVTRALPGKIFALFYRINYSAIWSITYRYLSMLSLGAYWCHLQLTKCCLWGKWTCPLISENYYLEWRCLLFLLKHMYFVLFSLTGRAMPPTACFRICSWGSATS